MKKIEYGVFQHTEVDPFIRSLKVEDLEPIHYQFIDRIGFQDKPASGAYLKTELLFRSYDVVECWNYISQYFENPETKKLAEQFLESV